eukprot:670377-Ditylum_brightwellii.AAC.1
MLLDSKVERLEKCSDREASQLISTLEGSPDWFQEQANVHPYVQAILNWKIGQRFATAVMLLDLYVLIMLIVSFRIASHSSLVARYDVLERIKATSSEMSCGDSMQGQSSAHSAMQDPSGRHFSFWSRDNPLQGDEAHFPHETQYIASNNDVDDDSLNFLWPIFFLYAGVFYQLMREIFQMISLARRGLFSSWLTDIWNYLDVACICLVGFTTLLMHRDMGNDEDVKLLIIITTAVLWMMILSFLKLTRRDFAVFVSGMIQ